MGGNSIPFFCFREIAAWCVAFNAKGSLRKDNIPALAGGKIPMHITFRQGNIGQSDETMVRMAYLEFGRLSDRCCHDRGRGEDEKGGGGKNMRSCEHDEGRMQWIDQRYKGCLSLGPKYSLDT